MDRLLLLVDTVDNYELIEETTEWAIRELPEFWGGPMPEDHPASVVVVPAEILQNLLSTYQGFNMIVLTMVSEKSLYSSKHNIITSR